MPISTEGYATASSSLSLKTQAGTSKVPHTIGFDASDLRMVIHNWDFELGSTYTDVDAATDLPVRAAFLIGGVVYPVTFRGSRDATVAPGGYVVSDPLGVEVTQGDVIYTLIYTSATSWQPNRASYTSSNSGGSSLTQTRRARGRHRPPMVLPRCSRPRWSPVCRSRRISGPWRRSGTRSRPVLGTGSTAPPT
ncbi:hypothetical protein [Rhodococcus ruber]|uniref:hypothetical protein n=1 Tax=Rhodococcus ruber TaxID=1830 RepID=UPI001E4F1FBD|nr:hypothetical protein [Rhodococcus ruber]MCD2127628.1 hypothetical protein [Rhodococcus ruber]MCZ4505954.1 hypothetical protein [Rhodococcus ruber]